MNKYDVEDFLRSLFECIVEAAKHGNAAVVHFRQDQCKSICNTLKHEAYITVNLEGVFEDDKN